MYHICSETLKVTVPHLLSKIYLVLLFIVSMNSVWLCYLFICRVTQNSFIVLFICHKRLHICAKACFLLNFFFSLCRSLTLPLNYTKGNEIYYICISIDLYVYYMCLCVLQKLNMQKPCHLLLFGTSSFRLLRLRFQKKFCNFVLIL